MGQCPMCGGQSVELGRLGNLTHYRCIQCGWIFAKESEDDDGKDS
jgi:rubredoxin